MEGSESIHPVASPFEGSMQLSPNCQTILLLTASFGRSVDQFEQPLSPAEWATFSQWLQAYKIDPAQLLSEDLTTLLDRWSDQKVSLTRLERLLGRDLGLGIAAERWEQAGLWILTQSHRNYPTRLKIKLGNLAPPVLFGCGNKNLINQGGVAIFGHTMARGDDILYTKKLAIAVSKYGKSVISGGVGEIDNIAIEKALKTNGSCIGLLAGSLIKTSFSKRYKQHLLGHSLVLVTPFNPEVAVTGNNAMVSNRYIYCLSDCAVIVDSTKSKRNIWKGAMENIRNNWVPIFAKENNHRDSGNNSLLEMGARHATLDISEIYREINKFRSAKSALKREEKTIIGAKVTSRNRKTDDRVKLKNRSQVWSTYTRIFIDTSSLLDDAAEFTAWQFIIPTCRHFGIPPPIIAKSVWDELNELERKGATDKKISSRARVALRLVEDLYDNGLINLIGDKDDESLNGEVYFSRFSQLYYKYQLVLFTQDMLLAKNILSINTKSRNDASQIQVFRIHADGPMRWELGEQRKSGVRLVRFGHYDGFQAINQLSTNIARKSSVFEYSSRSILNSSYIRPFEKCKHVANMDETLIDASIPNEGDFVKKADGSLVRLIKKIGSGGEGTVFETNIPELVCKVYYRECLKLSTIMKIELMTSRKISHGKICWPISVIYNVEGRGVGYIMPRATGRILRNAIFGKRQLAESFSHWKRLNIVRLALTILDAIEHLHKLNVVLGDINPANILVENESTVYFVDCDSYQVEGFPCPVGMPPFLAPELYGTDLHSTLRTDLHECFAVATLVFMLLHTGKPPYTYKGGQDLLSNVKMGNFPYSVDSQGDKDVPDGPWGYMWSQLPRYMRITFCDVFEDRKYKSVGEWRKLLEQYISDLNNGRVSGELYPKDAENLKTCQPEESEVSLPSLSFWTS